MKTRDLIACLQQANAMIKAKCEAAGHQLDELEIIENSEVTIFDEDSLRVKYHTNNYLAFVVIYFDDEQESIDQAELVTWIKE